jgi:hypothetical protein
MENCKKQLEKDTSWDILRFFPFFHHILHIHGWKQVVVSDDPHLRWVTMSSRRRLCLLLWTLSGINWSPALWV